MTPAELVVELERRLAAAQTLPATMATAAKATTKGITAPGVSTAVGRTGDGIVVRVLSVNPRLTSRAAAARIKPAVASSVEKAIRRTLA